MGFDDVDPLPGQVLPGVAGAGRRRAVDVDVAAVDRATGVLGEEPATVAVVAIGGDVDATAERDHAGVDRDRLIRVQWQRRPRRERHATQRYVLPSSPGRPAARLQRKRDATGDRKSTRLNSSHL